MARFNFDFGYEPKHRRGDRGRTARTVIIFLMVAAVTAAVIYAVVPKKTAKEGSGASAPAQPDLSVTANSMDGPAENPGGPAAAADGGMRTGGMQTGGSVESGKSAADAESGKTAADAETGKSAGKSGVKETVPAKFDPSPAAMDKLTADLRRSFADGSWKKHALTHTVASGDTLSRLANRFHTTVSFIQHYNNIPRANDIRIGKKISVIRAEGWNIVISRSAGKLALERGIDGKKVPFALFPCRVGAAKYGAELVVCGRFRHPEYTDAQGRRFAYGAQGNPLGEAMLTLASAARPNSPVRHWQIHGAGEKSAQPETLKDGGIVLSDEDIVLLYHLVPAKTPVKIVE